MALCLFCLFAVLRDLFPRVLYQPPEFSGLDIVFERTPANPQCSSNSTDTHIVSEPCYDLGLKWVKLGGRAAAFGATYLIALLLLRFVELVEQRKYLGDGGLSIDQRICLSDMQIHFVAQHTVDDLDDLIHAAAQHRQALCDDTVPLRKIMDKGLKLLTLFDRMVYAGILHHLLLDRQLVCQRIRENLLLLLGEAMVVRKLS